MSSYTCPFCGADDSTHCEKLPVLPVQIPGKKARFRYTPGEMSSAREVGCRVAHYVDDKSERDVDP